MIIEYLIGFWLIIGMLFDYKFYKVPNFISYSIVILSIPVIIINHTWTQPTIILGFKLFVALYFLAAWHFHKFGAADIKVIVPIMLMLSWLQFIAFLSLMLFIGVAIGIYLILRKGQPIIPGFVPITIAYWIALMI